MNIQFSMLSLILTLKKSIKGNSVSINENCRISTMHIWIYLSGVSLSLQLWGWVQNLADIFFFTRNFQLKSDTMAIFMILNWSIFSLVSYSSVVSVGVWVSCGVLTANQSSSSNYRSGLLLGSAEIQAEYNQKHLGFKQPPSGNLSF